MSRTNDKPGPQGTRHDELLNRLEAQLRPTRARSRSNDRMSMLAVEMAAWVGATRAARGEPVKRVVLADPVIADPVPDPVAELQSGSGGRPPNAPQAPGPVLVIAIDVNMPARELIHRLTLAGLRLRTAAAPHDFRLVLVKP